MAGPNSDAELIRLCEAFDALERQYDATFRTMDEDAGDVARDRIVEQQEPLLNRMTALRAKSREGLRARLESLLLWDKELGFGDAECEGECFNTRLLAALLRDLDRLLPGRAAA